MARQTKSVSLGTLAQNTKFTIAQGNLKGISGVVYKQHESVTQFVLLGNKGLSFIFPDGCYYGDQELVDLPNTRRVHVDNSAKPVFAEQLNVGDQIIYLGKHETVKTVFYNPEHHEDVLSASFESGVTFIGDKTYVFELIEYAEKESDFEFTVLVGNSRNVRAGTYEFSMSDITTMTDQEKIDLVDTIFHNASEKLLDMEN